MSVNLVDNHLYAANSIKSYILLSTVPELKNHCKVIVGGVFDLKHYTLNTADIIKQTLNDKKKIKKSMKRKTQEDEDQYEAPPSLKARSVPTWRHKAKSEN
ncbi:hypothetical protein RMATCC62417_03531 [Rhizopus microsporus]|nr:hypothetical protein RMATCC62417_03531 [Rhizopus microsporus]